MNSGLSPSLPAPQASSCPHAHPVPVGYYTGNVTLLVMASPTLAAVLTPQHLLDPFYPHHLLLPFSP